MAEEPISSDLVLVDATNLLLPSTETFLCRFWENVKDFIYQESIMVLIMVIYPEKTGDWLYHFIINHIIIDYWLYIISLLLYQ